MGGSLKTIGFGTQRPAPIMYSGPVIMAVITKIALEIDFSNLLKLPKTIGIEMKLRYIRKYGF